jgi:2-oxoglutarate ferredoxin oxidoreductase subunit beta
MSELADKYRSDAPSAWCPGCGNFAILDCLQKALVELELPPERVIVVSDVGQAAKLPHYMNVNTFNGLHGRAVSEAIGVKLAAPDMTVVVHAGDGGTYGEGGNHLLHAIRRNIDLTVVVHDNHYYGLTKGQASPTLPLETKTKIQPRGVSVPPLNPLALAISQDCSFVAQGTAARTDHLVQLLVQGIRHKGFALINTLQPCVTYDKVFTFKYYKEHCTEVGDDRDRSDRQEALRLVEAGNAEREVPIGVIYSHQRETLDEVLTKRADTPLRERGVRPSLVSELLEALR